MPQRIRGPQRAKEVSPHVFECGDGTWSYFNNPDKGVWAVQVYATREEAYPHWCEQRREVWAGRNRFRPPNAACIYDGITWEARELLWRTWQSTDLSLIEMFRALAADRAAVEAFRREDPEAAGDVDDFLTLWLEDLDAIESEARRISEARERGERFPGAPKIGSAHTYGDDATALGSHA